MSDERTGRELTPREPEDDQRDDRALTPAPVGERVVMDCGVLGMSPAGFSATDRSEADPHINLLTGQVREGLVGALVGAHG